MENVRNVVLMNRDIRMADRLINIPKIDLGRHYNSIMMAIMDVDGRAELGNPENLRTVMGFRLPVWQRGSVWTESQKISFIESAWKGIPLGTYSFTQIFKIGHPLDNLLIDGQQRMSAIDDYVNDKFKVFGYYFSEIGEIDIRMWNMIVFPSYVIANEDEEYLKNYYNLMNFGGTAHKDSERAR